MTQPPVDPTPTEPVPALDPVPAPSAVTAGTPAWLDTGATSSAVPAWAPASPEGSAVPPAWAPAPPEGAAPPPAAAPSRSVRASSRPLTIALAGVILAGAVGLAFAAGRATAPVADAGGAGAVSGRQDPAAGQDGAARPDAGGGALPDASFDLDGDGDGRGGPGGDMDGDGAFPGRGPGRDGFGGVGVGGTVTAVDGDSLTIETDAGLTVTVSLDASTTYHQQAPATRADVTTGDTVEVEVSGGFRPGRPADGSTMELGTAGDVTIVP